MVSILYITANPNHASSNVPTEVWFQRMQEHGFQPVLVSAVDGDFRRWSQAQGIPTYVVRLHYANKRRPWQYVGALWRLRQIVRKHGIQLIHSIEQNEYPLAADLAWICRLPVVVGVHCRVLEGFGRWAFGGRRCPDRLFFLSRGSREICRPAVEGVVPESRWRLLPNGLDLDKFRPDSSLGRRFRHDHDLGDWPLVGAAVWLRPGKQLEHLFQVVANLNEKVSLAIAGGVAPGEESYAQELLATGRRMLGKRLQFVGCLSDLRGFYSALDLFVNTSRAETCSISILESLACGCPVIGYPSVSVNEQVLPGGGEIVAQDDIQALTTAVGRWLFDTQLRTTGRAAARRRVEDAYDIRRISDQLWDEYQDVLSERSRRFATTEHQT